MIFPPGMPLNFTKLVMWCNGGGEFYKSKQLQNPDEPASTSGFNLDSWELLEGDASAQSYRLTKDEKTFTSRLQQTVIAKNPPLKVVSWKNINPFENPSNVSTKEAALFLRN